MPDKKVEIAYVMCTWIVHGRDARNASPPSLWRYGKVEIKTDRFIQRMTPCILDYIGCLGPLILIPFTMINLRMQPNLLFVYLIFLIINTVMNALLKSLIREHRPDGQILLDGLEAKTGMYTYGMPSGHAQSVAYTTATLFLVSRSVSLLVCVSVVGILTL